MVVGCGWFGGCVWFVWVGGCCDYVLRLVACVCLWAVEVEHFSCWL